MIKVFVTPAILALMTAIGLVSALLGNDHWDALSWVLLTVPIAVTVWHFCRAVRPQ